MTKQELARSISHGTWDNVYYILEDELEIKNNADYYSIFRLINLKLRNITTDNFSQIHRMNKECLRVYAVDLN